MSSEVVAYRVWVVDSKEVVQYSHDVHKAPGKDADGEARFEAEVAMKNFPGCSVTIIDLVAEDLKR